MFLDRDISRLFLFCRVFYLYLLESSWATTETLELCVFMCVCVCVCVCVCMTTILSASDQMAFTPPPLSHWSDIHPTTWQADTWYKCNWILRFMHLLPSKARFHKIDTLAPKPFQIKALWQLYYEFLLFWSGAWPTACSWVSLNAPSALSLSISFSLAQSLNNRDERCLNFSNGWLQASQHICASWSWRCTYRCSSIPVRGSNRWEWLWRVCGPGLFVNPSSLL